MVPADTLLEEETRKEIDEKLEACGYVQVPFSKNYPHIAPYLDGK